MARVRGGNTGFAVALVIFGCGFVISLLVAIIFYTKIEEAKVNEQQAKDDLKVFITGGETTQANEYKSTEGTVFGNMRDKIIDLDSDLREAQEEITKLTSATKNMESVYGVLANEKKAVEDQLAAEVASSAKTSADLKADLDQAQRETLSMQDQVTALQERLNDALKDADQAAQDRIAQLTEEVKALETTGFNTEREKEEWRKKYQDLLASLPKPPTPNTTTPDGEVASVFGDGNDLFITRGRKDGLVMGMTFEVFDPLPVIKLAVTGEARGKATIEVYGLNEDSATCRVVRRDRNVNITPGDPIVNLAYDPNMTIRMYAFGDFDIEGDGGTNDIGRIEAIIKDSGAELIELTKNDAGIPILTPDLNYIVLGEKPVLPEKPSDQDFDPVKIAEYQAQLSAYEAYFRIVDDAKIMRIPVLNQGRFLDLMGYYVR
jgi:archaellum component FlaC